MFLEISQNSLESTSLCQSFFLNKVAGLSPATLSKKRLWHKCFNFAKLPRTPFCRTPLDDCFWKMQFGISQLIHYRLTFSQTVFRDFKWINAFKWLLSIAYKMCLRTSFLLYLLVEILQLVHEIAVSRRWSIKGMIWKTSQNSQINIRSSHTEVLSQKSRCF